MKEESSLCYIVQSGLISQAILQGNQIIQVKKDTKKNNKSKIFATLQKGIQFSISKTQILQNKKYKFYLQLKIKSNESLTIIVQGKQNLEYFIKHLCEYGIIKGLQQMMVSCQKIGQGSFAEVYKVITNYDTVMALKAFDKKNLKIHKNKLSFQNQIDIMRALKSKYIVSVEGLFQTQKNIYIKMQYFNLSLKSYLKKNPSIKIQKRIMKQLLQALVQMKHKHIIHRDLKPENVMIRGKHQKNLQCVIIDFGLATPVNVEKYIYNRCGTPGFLAPQIAKMSNKKDKLTPACDIFSLACIFYKILSKKYIFAAQNYNQVIQKNKNVSIPWENFDKFSLNQQSLLRRMLQKDPSKRITPQQALNHPYFDHEVDDQDDIPVQDCDLGKKMRNFQSTTSTINRRQSTESIMHSFNSNSQGDFGQKDSMYTLTMKKKIQIKDSCLSFQGPVKAQDSQKQSQLRQRSHLSHRTKKRVSRFSQINQIPIL